MKKSDHTIDVYPSSCLEIGGNVKQGSVTLVVADPPYATGTRKHNRKDYGNDSDTAGRPEFMDFTWEWVQSVVRVMSRNASIFVMISGNRAADVANIMTEQGLKHCNHIVWHYTQGQGTRNKFSIRHDTILWFTKSNNFTFNLDDVRVPQKFYRKVNNMRGTNPGDVWAFPRVASHVKSRQSHPTQKPEGLIERMVLAASNEGETVLDPFSGSGTTARVCQQLRRNFVGFELNEAYVDMTIERLDQKFTGFDSTDERMLRVPIEMNDPAFRETYFDNHQRWFLHNRGEAKIEQFIARWRQMYGAPR